MMVNDRGDTARDAGSMAINKHDSTVAHIKLRSSRPAGHINTVESHDIPGYAIGHRYGIGQHGQCMTAHA